MKYFIDHNKTANASTITWLSKETTIESLNPYIESIICDNGEDYIGLSAGDFEVLSIDGFEVIEGVEEDTYILCYTAIVSINLENHIDFKNALQLSDNMIIVHIGFKDSNGNELDDVCEGNIDIPVELVKSPLFIKKSNNFK